jgi:hypothetical protein
LGSFHAAHGLYKSGAARWAWTVLLVHAITCSLLLDFNATLEAFTSQFMGLVTILLTCGSYSGEWRM